VPRSEVVLQGMVSGGHVQGIGDQVGAHMVGHRIADDLPIEAVDHGGQIQPAGPGADVAGSRCSTGAGATTWLESIDSATCR
jgi:hypothetical protein